MILAHTPLEYPANILCPDSTFCLSKHFPIFPFQCIKKKTGKPFEEAFLGDNWM
jgi:hypothetical protein